MVSLKFQIDEPTLAFHTVASLTKDAHYQEWCPSMVPFLERAQVLDAKACELTEYQLADRSFLIEYGPEGKTAENLLHSLEVLAAKLQHDPTFVPVLNETKEAMAKLEGEWQLDESLSNTIMKELTGLKLDENFDVYVIHPCFDRDVGKSERRIIITYRKRSDKYNVANLWYYICYLLLNEGVDQDSTKGRAIHCILDLLFVQLKKRLDEKWEMPKPQGDKLILEDSWQHYLQQTGQKDINQYIDQASHILDSASKTKSQ